MEADNNDRVGDHELIGDVDALLNIPKSDVIETTGLGFDILVEEQDMDNIEITANLEPIIGGRLLDDELLNFVGVHFPEEQIFTELRSNRTLTTKPELNRKGGRIIWFENSITGELIPIAKRMPSGTDGAGGTDALKMVDSELDATDSILAGVDGDEAEPKVGSHSFPIDDDENLSPLLSAIPSPPPLLPTGITANNDKINKSGRRIDMDEAGNGKRSGDEWDEASKITAYNNLVTAQRGAFLFFQGLLAGFVFTTIYSIGTDTNNEQFLLNYQPNAQEYRRLFYFLSTISLVGSADLTLTIIRSRSSSKMHSNIIHLNNKKSTGDQHTRAMAVMGGNNTYDSSSMLSSTVITLLYLVVYLATILMTSEDVLIANKNGYSGSSWAASALEDDKFSSGLTNWKNLNAVRFVCAVLAWVGSCLFAWKDLKQLNKRTEDLYRLSETALAWKQRTELMEGGEGIDSLNPAEIKRLLTLLAVGLNRAREVLEFGTEEVVEDPNDQQQEADSPFIPPGV
mmetsp:Transcript_24341/g.33418  ORF Transcript_24341/g.33418 Transcript_24341/m.33418 type:complete len:513 (+) Transcript_24341:32-1570(+)